MIVPKTIEDELFLLNYIENEKKNFQEPIDTKEFLIHCKLVLNPQSYGAKIQKRWIKDNLYISVDSSKNRGDYKDKNLYVEFKVSYQSNDGWTLLQLRPYQDITRYDILLVDKNYDYTLYKIPKKEMEILIEKYGGHCHGTKVSNMDNKNIEYRMDIQRKRLHEIKQYESDTSVKKSGKFF